MTMCLVLNSDSYGLTWSYLNSSQHLSAYNLNYLLLLWKLRLLWTFGTRFSNVRALSECVSFRARNVLVSELGMCQFPILGFHGSQLQLHQIFNIITIDHMLNYLLRVNRKSLKRGHIHTKHNSKDLKTSAASIFIFSGSKY